jgi:hypothetical protein
MRKKQIKNRNQLSFLEIPKIYLTINEKVYRAMSPEKALAIGKTLTGGVGNYKIHVIYGKERISKRKLEAVENKGKYESAREAKQALLAFLDESLWVNA